MKVYPFQDALKTADVPGWAYDDSGDTFDLASALQPSHAHGWTAVQVLTPILVAVALCLIFALYILHRKGRLARLASMLPSMRSHRQGRRPRGWADDGDPSGVDSHDTPDAEAAPMIADQPHRWNSLSSRDVSNHQHHGLPAQGMVTRVFQAVFRSLRGLFGKGPVQVSHRSDPDSFDIEDSDSEIDPFDTLRTRSSKSRGIGIANYGTNGASAADLIASTHNFFRPGEVTRPRGSPDPTDDHHEYDDFLGGIQDPSLDGHSSGMATGDSVLLISRNGRDFSIRGSIATSRQSTLIGRPVLEEDRRSMDVVPPTPTKSGQRSRGYHARSASTPQFQSPTSEEPPPHARLPSQERLPSYRAHRPPPLPTIPPLPPPMQATASKGSQNSSPAYRDGLPVHYTAATPPVDACAAPAYPRHSPNASVGSAQSGQFTPPVGAPEPVLSPHLQHYTPSFPGRAHAHTHARGDGPAGSYFPPPAPPSRAMRASDPQNLIPSAVRGAGYNPFQHGRSLSDPSSR